MEEKWVVKRKWAPFQKLAEEFGIDPLIVRLMRNRDVFTEEDLKTQMPDGHSLAEKNIDRFLHATTADLYDPALMKDMKKAGQVIIDAVGEKKKIRVIGDYDIDGIMSTYILVNGLKKIGADVDWQIPDRMKDGYGLNENLIRKADADGVQLIVTCDNGIAARDQIALGNDLGMQIVVTDHHQVPFETVKNGDGTEKRKEILPPADAVIDPHRADDSYPFKGLCGAGVAWKLITYLYRETGVGDADKEAEKFLQFAAIATVGDVMDLTDENRIIVREGLKQLRRTENPGLRELIRQNNLDPEKIDVYHIGFVIGPCLNASGRLDTAARALNMLMTSSVQEASEAASELMNLNESRKGMTETGTAEAMRKIDTTSLIDDRVLIVYLPDSHPSVVGIIAGRIKEHYNRPTFVLTDADGMIRGSGRSIDAYNMYDELVKCADLFTAFGGHPKAAGVTLPKENLQAFHDRMNEKCSLTEEDMTPVVKVDAVMPQTYVTTSLIRELDVLRPTGNGNERPIFGEVRVTARSPRIVGQKQNCCLLQVVSEDGSSAVKAIYFGRTPDDARDFYQRITDGTPFSIIYEPQIDSWMGRDSVQLHIIHYK